MLQPNIYAPNDRWDSIITLFMFAILTSAFVIIEPAPTDLLMVSAVAVAVLLKKIQFSKDNMFAVLLMSLFLLSNLISMMLTQHFSVSVAYLMITLYLAIGWFGIVGVATASQQPMLKWLMNAYVIIGVIVAVLGIITYAGLLPFDVLFFGDRVKLFFKDPNVYGPFLVPIALYFLVKHGERGNWLDIVLFSIVTMGIIVSFSRGSWLNLAVVVGIVFLFSRTKQKMFLVAIATVLGAFFLWIMMGNQDFLQQFTGRLGLQGYDEGRFSNHELAWALGIISPFGVGPGASDYELMMSPHNVYARVFVENGWLGILSWIVFLFSTLYVSFQKYMRTKNTLYFIIGVAIIGQLVNGFFIDILHWRHFWLLLALAWIPLLKEMK